MREVCVGLAILNRIDMDHQINAAAYVPSYAPTVALTSLLSVRLTDYKPSHKVFCSVHLESAFPTPCCHNAKCAKFVKSCFREVLG